MTARIPLGEAGRSKPETNASNSARASRDPSASRAAAGRPLAEAPDPRGASPDPRDLEVRRDFETWAAGQRGQLSALRWRLRAQDIARQTGIATFALPASVVGMAAGALFGCVGVFLAPLSIPLCAAYGVGRGPQLMAEKVRDWTRTTAAGKRLSPGKLLALLQEGDERATAAVIVTRALSEERFDYAAAQLSDVPSALSLVQPSPGLAHALSLVRPSPGLAHELARTEAGADMLAALIRQMIDRGSEAPLDQSDAEHFEAAGSADLSQLMLLEPPNPVLNFALDGAVRNLPAERLQYLASQLSGKGGAAAAALLRRSIKVADPEGIGRVLDKLGDQAVTEACLDPSLLHALIGPVPEHPVILKVLRGIQDSKQRTDIGRALLRHLSRQFWQYQVKDGVLLLRCPCTKRTMQDPYLDFGRGNTYSAEAVDRSEAHDGLVPNFVARTLLEKYPDGRVPLEAAAIDQALSCPIAHDTMVVPVVDPLGHTYDLLHLLQHMEASATRGADGEIRLRSPLTNQAYSTRGDFSKNGLLIQLVWHTEALREDVSSRYVDHHLQIMELKQRLKSTQG